MLSNYLSAPQVIDERVTQLLARGTQATIGQGGQRCRMGSSVGQRPQHAPCTDAQQIRDEAGQLNVGFFQ
jgi:hypothetical protein